MPIDGEVVLKHLHLILNLLRIIPLHILIVPRKIRPLAEPEDTEKTGGEGSRQHLPFHLGILRRLRPMLRTNRSRTLDVNEGPAIFESDLQIRMSHKVACRSEEH